MHKRFTIKKTSFMLVFILVISTFSLTSQILSNGTGNWSSTSSWVGGVVPTAGDDVYIQTGHTITLTGNAACKDLHLHITGKRLDIGANTLEVSGKIRAYSASVGTTPGNPETSTGGIFTSTSPGALKFVGTTRTLMNSGEWGAGGPTGGDMIFALNSGETGTFGLAFKARSMTFESGNYTTNNSIRPDAGNSAGGNGTLTIKSGAKLTMTSGSASIQRVSSASNTSHFQSLTLESGGILELDGPTIIGAGTITLNGKVILSGDSLLHRGDNSGGAQIVSYTKLESKGPKKLMNNITVLDSLSLMGVTGPNLNLGSFNLTAAGVINTNGNKYIVADGTGKLIRPVGSSEVVFPIGTSTSSTTTTIKNNGTADNFSVNVSTSVPALCGATNQTIPIVWNISEGTPGASDCDITLDYGSITAPAGFAAASAKIIHCASPRAFNGSVTGTKASGTGFTTFSPYGITSDPSVLPVKLTSFSGKQVDDIIALDWATSSERNSDYFDVMSSPDGVQFKNIGKVRSEGNSNSLVKYAFIDEKPYKGTNYYKLKQVDFDGKYEFSNIITVENTTPSNTAIYPSLRNNMEMNFIDLTEYSKDENVTILLYNASGRNIHQSKMPGGSVSNIDFGLLSTGLYLIKVSNGAKTETLKLSVY
jgi:hypothetical protein